MKRIFNILNRFGRVLKFFITKHWTQVMALVLLLAIFTLGFTIAWQIQNRRDNVRALEQDRLITHLMTEQMRNNKVFRDITMLLLAWEEKIYDLEQELNKLYKNMKKQIDWNEGNND